jgi:uncharacterized membrane protein
MKKEGEEKQSSVGSSEHAQLKEHVANEELTIEDLHADMERRLQEEGFTFDKKKFIFQDKHLSFGERLADKVASFGGSWTFIILFGCFIFLWIGLNLYWLANKSFDPFPFILLNLMLSCLASLQAPIIMMSQNRQAMKDRHQQEINLEKDIIDFKQDRLDLILDQKEYDILKDMSERLRRVEEKLGSRKSAGKKPRRKK